MKKLGKYYQFERFHFLGINGVSMDGLAKFCAIKGKKVSGSDLNLPKNPERLKNLGIKFFKGHEKSNVKGTDVVIYTSAVKEDNVEITSAKKRNIPLVKRSELLGEIAREFNYSVAVSGSHGKTTATAMIADVLIGAKKSPTVFLGGESPDYGNFRYGHGEYVLLEACEYQKNLLDINAKVSVVLNVDNDHMECYKDMADVEQTFNKFIGQNVAVVNADDSNSRLIGNNATVTFGIEKSANYYATKIKNENGKYSFNACAFNQVYGRINLSVIGYHNIYNALATFAVGDLFNIPFDVIKGALENFRGVKRRQELLAKKDGVSFYADYAHHPREISATLCAFGEMEKVLVVFQPHTYSRTKILMKEFVCSLKDLPNLIIYKTFPARENFSIEGDGRTLFYELVNNDKDVPNNFYRSYADNFEELYQAIKQKEGIEKVIFLGAGDVYEVAKKLVKEL